MFKLNLEEGFEGVKNDWKISIGGQGVGRNPISNESLSQRERRWETVGRRCLPIDLQNSLSRPDLKLASLNKTARRTMIRRYT